MENQKKGIDIVGMMNAVPAKIMGLLKQPKSPQAAPQATQAVPEAPLPQQEVAAQPQMAEPQTVVAEAPKSKMPKLKVPKKLIIGIVFIAIVLIVLMIAMQMLNGGRGNIFTVESPSESPSSTPTVEVPSQYADDTDVAEINKRMEALDQELNSASFRDDRLRVPSLDWNVSFE